MRIEVSRLPLEIERENQIKRMYIESEMSTLMIAQALGISHQAVSAALVRRGMKLRSLSEASKLKMRAGRGHPIPPRFGADNNLWKGGKYRSPQGYIFVKAWGHPRANANGYVRQHILVWEEDHGRALPDDWVVHHINGKRDDNRPENLLAVPKHTHSYNLLLQAVQKRLREVEQKLKSASAQKGFGE